MNLLDVLSTEINQLNLSEPYAIARYIYVRTGELFNYNPVYIFASEKQRDILKKLRVDIENVQDFNIICYSWAPMYVDLLRSFNINAKVIKNDRHAAVIIEIDGIEFFADLTSFNQDITRIKFGMEIKNFYQITTESEYSFHQIDQSIYTKSIKLEEVLFQMRCECQCIKSELTLEKYNYFTFKMIEGIMNFDRPNVGFVSGVTFINELLKVVFDDCNISYYKYFFDIEKKVFIKLYAFSAGERLDYFTYEQHQDFPCKLHQITEDMRKLYLRTYSLCDEVDMNRNAFRLVHNKR